MFNGIGLVSCIMTLGTVLLSATEVIYLLFISACLEFFFIFLWADDNLWNNL